MGALGEALRWYLALAAIGAGGLLPALLLFGRLRSGGLLFARPLALAGIAVLGWNASALGVAPWGAPLVVALVALAWGWSGWLWWRRPALREALRTRWRLLATGEALFLVLFTLILLARAQAPAALHTEKPMDLMLLTAVHRAERLPPPDPWLAGERISYYHLGHTQVDAVARVAGLGPALAFNLGLAATGAMAGLAAFALGGDLLRLGRLRRHASAWAAGALAAVGLLWLGPLAGLVSLLEAGGVPQRHWWWWDATRVVPDTISEFPAFSLLLGDLHAHVLALPLGLTALGLTLVAFEGGTPLTWRRWLSEPGALALAAVLFAALAMTNSWDVLTFGTVWLGAAALAYARVGWGALPALLGAGRHLAAPALLALVLAAPFWATLDTPPLGLAPVQGEHSDPARFLLVWGTPLIPLGVALLALRPPVARAVAGWTLGVSLALVLLWGGWLLTAGAGAELAARGWGWLTLAGLAAGVALLAGAAAGAGARGEAGLAGALWLAMGALGLLLLTELVRIDDAFPGRMNTVFKIWFHAWALLALAGAAALAAAADRVPLPAPGRASWQAAALGATGIAGALYLGAMLYAPAMAVSRAREGQERGLDALAEWRRLDAGLAATVTWANSELDPGRHVLLEAVGQSYGGGNALSAASAVPTLLGWPNHQRQWRGQSADLVAREQAVRALYEAGAGEEALALAEGWGVTHVYLGREERRQFGPGVVERFEGWPVAFEHEGARVVAVPSPAGTTP